MVQPPRYTARSDNPFDTLARFLAARNSLPTPPLTPPASPMRPTPSAPQSRRTRRRNRFDRHRTNRSDTPASNTTAAPSVPASELEHEHPPTYVAVVVPQPTRKPRQKRKQPIRDTSFTLVMDFVRKMLDNHLRYILSLLFIFGLFTLILAVQPRRLFTYVAIIPLLHLLTVLQESRIRAQYHVRQSLPRPLIYPSNVETETLFQAFSRPTAEPSSLTMVPARV